MAAPQLGQGKPWEGVGVRVGIGSSGATSVGSGSVAMGESVPNADGGGEARCGGWALGVYCRHAGSAGLCLGSAKNLLARLTYH